MANPLENNEAKTQYILDEIIEAVEADPDHFYHTSALEERDGALFGYFIADGTQFTIEVWVAPGPEKSADRIVLDDTATMTLDR